MKTKSYIYLCVVMLFCFSCKKDQEVALGSKETTTTNVSLENDYLRFEDYETFFKTFQNLSTLPESDRIAWEKGLKFVSLRTIYQKFDLELRDLETKTKSEYFVGYSALRQKYKKQFLFTDSSYRLNSSGVFESFISNKDGIVKIGNDFLYFTNDGIETFKKVTYEQVIAKINNPSTNPPPQFFGEILATNTQKSSASARGKTSFVVGSQSGLNSFTVNSSAFNSVLGDSGRGIFFARAKIYNIHNSTIGYRGFATFECYSQHKNIFGTWRDVQSIVGAFGEIDVLLGEIVSGYPFGKFTEVRATLPSLTGSNGQNQPRYEFVIAASNALMNNPSILTQTVGSFIQFGSQGAAIDDDFIQATNGHWESIAAGGFIQAETFISATSFDSGIFGAPLVNFPDLRMVY